jgi:hypothetical protein
MSESQIPMHPFAAGISARDLAVPGDIESPGDARTRSTGFAALRPRLVRAAQTVFSFPVMLAAALVGRVFYEIRVFTVDPDLWWHLKTGQEILRTHHWPTTDPYSFTVFGQPWMAAEWLGDVVFAMVARLDGVRALDVFLIALGSAILVALYALATFRSGNSKAALVAVVLISPLATASFNLRPQMFGYLFLILTLIVLERFRQGHKGALWLLPPLFLIWINTHGSWIIGLGVIFAFWAAGMFRIRMGQLESALWTPADRRQISFVFLLCLLALPLTPYGTKMAMYPYEVASQLPLSTANISEWLPMPFNLLGGKFFLGIVLALFFAQAALRLRWRIDEFVLFLFGAAMACIHTRFLLLFVPFTAPLLATIFGRWVPRYDRRKDLYALNAVLMAAIVGAMFYYLPPATYVQQRMKEQFPVEAVEYMAQHPVPEPMFDAYGFGGYLVWKGQRVFIDGRSELYERGGILADYLRIANVKPGAPAVLRLYGIQSVLVENNSHLATLLSDSPEWKRVYTDNLSVIYVRSRPLGRQGAD